MPRARIRFVAEVHSTTICVDKKKFHFGERGGGDPVEVWVEGVRHSSQLAATLL